MKIVVTGATGFIGRALTQRLLREGHAVSAWVRDEVTARNKLGAHVDLIPVSSGDEGLNGAIEGADAVINLAGEPIFPKRWTAAQKTKLRDSRISLTRRICRAIERASNRPSVFLSASAVGYYGAFAGDTRLDEGSPAGNDFLAELCRDWELAAAPAKDAGVRVVNVRIGVVLGREGGALANMLPPFRMGAGGRIGSGRQYMPWIHLTDLVELFVTALNDERYAGPINGTSPDLIDNRAFTRALGRAVSRPTIVPVPAAALRVLFGDAADVLLGGQCAQPARSLALGFKHRFADIDAALADIVVDDRGVHFAKAADTPSTEYLTRRPPTHVLETITRIDAPLEEVFDFFSQAANLGAMTPPAMSFDIQTPQPIDMKTGTLIDYKIKLGPLPMKWRTEITNWTPGEKFVDAQLVGPYASWWHEHSFVEDGDQTIMTDRVYYAAPLGPLGRLANRLFVQPVLQRIFAFRAQVVEYRFGENDGSKPKNESERYTEAA